MFIHFSILCFSLINGTNGPVWEFPVGFYLLSFPSESLTVFFTSSFPGLKNLSFSEPNPLKGILSFFFRKSLVLTSIHFCWHSSRCQTGEPAPVPSVTSAITTSCSRKAHGRQNKKNLKKKKSKQIFQSQKVSGEQLWSEPPREALRRLAMHLQQLRRASAPGRGPHRGSWCRAGGAAAGRGPRAGHGCFFQRPTSGWLAGAHPRSLPPSLPPSLPDPVRGGAIVTDTIPVLKPLH